MLGKKLKGSTGCDGAARIMILDSMMIVAAPAHGEADDSGRRALSGGDRMLLDMDGCFVMIDYVAGNFGLIDCFQVG